MAVQIWTVRADNVPMGSRAVHSPRSTDKARPPRTARPIQPALEIGAVDDPLEAEAERTADRVMAALSAPGTSTGETARAAVEEEELLQGARTTRATEDDELLQGARTTRATEDDELLQGAPAGTGPEGGAVDAALESRLTSGGGAPLPDPVRSRMEASFGGVDFSGVRVSENSAAGEIGARAYTTGADIRFAPGQYRPDTAEGQHLLAHELTHVVQQGAAVARSSVVRRDSEVDTAAAVGAFLGEHPGRDHLVAGLDGVTDKHQVWRILVDNFFDRTDFAYTANNKPAWGAGGDCATLVAEYVETLTFFGISAKASGVSAGSDGFLYVTPRPIVDATYGNGNIDKGTGGWIFETHTWAETEFGPADILFGQLGNVAYVQGKDGEDAKRNVTVGVNGKVYSYALGAATANDRWTADPSRWFAT